MRIKPPWWFCNGWWSPWCVLDTWAHRLGLPLPDEDHPRQWWICRKHDSKIT